MVPGRLFKTASFRLASLYAVLFAVSASLLFGVIYWIAGEALEKQIQDALVREASSLAEVRQTGGMDALIRSIDERLAVAGPSQGYALLMDASGRKLTGNLAAVTPVDGFVSLPWPGNPDQEPDSEEDSEHSVIAFGRTLPGGSFLLVGEDGYTIYEAKEAILSAFGWGMATALLLAVGGGILVSSGFLRRIDAINRTTRAIVAGNLDDRVPRRATDDELDQLAANLNTMLDRIQTLMESLRQVSSDVAHDLRLPLQHLRQRLEGARLRTGDMAQCHEVLGLAIADTDNVLGIFTAILSIAQIESGTRRAAFVEVDLSDAVHVIAESYGAVAEDQGQTVTADVAAGVFVRGDRALLTQMLVNLVENAIRHCPHGTRIALVLQRERDGVAVSVNDTGPGIPREEWPKVFKRFYRMDHSRSTPGSGLGLALVKAVADLHGATIQLSDAMPGLRVRVFFPSA